MLNDPNFPRFLTFYRENLGNSIFLLYYYKLRDQRVPSEFTDKIAIMENTHTFLRGLRNREIAKILSRNRQQIDFKDLGSTASHYETVENQKWD